MDVAEVLGWPFRDPRWRGRLLGMGAIWLLLGLTVIGAIPAFIAINGWMLRCLDNLREGRVELASPGLPLRRGLPLAVVEVAWLLVFVAVALLLSLAGVSLSHTGTAGVLAGGMLAVLGNAIALLGSVALLALLPGLALLVDRRGLAAGFDVPAIWRLAGGAGAGTVLAGLLSLLALDIISPLGLIACLVGAVFTTPYAYAVLAATIQSFERMTEGGSDVSAAG